jgi:hypothetical protein
VGVSNGCLRGFNRYRHLRPIQTMQRSKRYNIAIWRRTKQFGTLVDNGLSTFFRFLLRTTMLTYIVANETKEGHEQRHMEACQFIITQRNENLCFSLFFEDEDDNRNILPSDTTTKSHTCRTYWWKHLCWLIISYFKVVISY